MVINAVKDTRPFMYNDFKLDEVNSFKYLGMTINRRAMTMTIFSENFYSTGKGKI